jgi:uncharacterized protein (DUF1330 family)
MRNIIYLFLAFSVLSSCETKSEAQKIVDQSIAAHGGNYLRRQESVLILETEIIRFSNPQIALNI